MADATRRAETGQAIGRVLTAPVTNELLTIPRRVRQLERTGAKPPPASAFDRAAIPVKNVGGSARKQFEPIVFGEVLFSPTDNLAHFRERLVFEGAAYTSDDGGKRFGICETPIAVDKIGRVRVAGWTQAKIYVEDEAHDRARPTTDSAEYLKANAVEGAKIIWKESGTGLLWGVVDLDNSQTAPKWQATASSAGFVATSGPDVGTAVIAFDTVDDDFNSAIGTLDGGILKLTVGGAFLSNYKVIGANPGTAADAVVRFQRSRDLGSTWTDFAQATTQDTLADDDKSYSAGVLVSAKVGDWYRILLVDQTGNNAAGYDGSNAFGQGPLWNFVGL